MLNLKRVFSLFILLAFIAVGFMACEQDLLSSELETSELEYRGPKPFAEVLCQPTGDTQEIPKSCQGMGSNCRKVKACRDVQSLSREEYLLFLRESFGD